MPTQVPNHQVTAALRWKRCLVILGVVLTLVGGTGTRSASAEGTMAGDAIPSPDRGGSDTVFELQLPAGAACSGDTVTGGYLVYSYIVPSTVDPSVLRFGSDGPIGPDGSSQANGVYPLFDTTQQAYAQKNTNVGTGAVPTLPQFQYDPPFTTSEIPPGDYNVGIACAKGTYSTGNPANGDRYWNTAITFTADSTDAGGYVWKRKGSAANETTTTVTADPPGGSTTGQTVTIGAAVTGASTAGSLNFRIDGTDHGTTKADGDGKASISTGTLGAGPHTFEVDFLPDDPAVKASKGSISYSVTQSTAGATSTTTGLTASPTGSAPQGSQVTLTATLVPSDAAGKVRFSDGSRDIATADVLGGASTVRTSDLLAGAHSITATFVPTSAADFGGSSSAPLDYTIGAASAASTSLAMTATAGSGKTVVLSATVAPAAAAGTISFLDSNTTLSSKPAASGSATFTTAALTNGTHAFKATFTPTSATTYSSSISPVVNVTISDSGATVSSTTTTAAMGTGTTVSTSTNVTVATSGTASGATGGASNLSTSSSATPRSSGGGLPVTGATIFPLMLFAALLLIAGWYALRGARNNRIDQAMRLASSGGRRVRPGTPSADLVPIFGPTLHRAGAEPAPAPGSAPSVLGAPGPGGPVHPTTAPDRAVPDESSNDEPVADGASTAIGIVTVMGSVVTALAFLAGFRQAGRRGSGR